MRSAFSVVITIAALTLGLVPPGAPGVAAAAPATPGTAADLAPQPERAAPADVKRKVVLLTNKRRRANGCRPLKAVRALNVAAQGHSRRMAAANELSHKLPGEPNAGARLRRAGYHWTMWGENIAYGQPTARAVVKAWMRSPGHRRNILTCRFRHIGVGLALSDSGAPYWTQDFGRR